MTPRVTVAISTYNRAHLVTRAIASAQAQTFPDIEILVVDDGSTDRTPDILASIRDPRVRVVRHEKNGGISRTRNTAITSARGDWLAFLDDDNEWMSTYLERQLALAACNPAAGVTYCRARRRDDRNGRESVFPATICQGPVFSHLVAGWTPLVSCVLFRRSTLVNVGGLDEALRATEDHDLWLRLAQCAEFAGMADVLVTRHEHSGSQLSRNHALLRRDINTLDRKWRPTILQTNGRSAYRQWRARLVVVSEMAGVLNAVEGGRRSGALRHVGRMLAHLPWSAWGVTRGLALTMLGASQYLRLAAKANGILTPR